MPTVPSHGGQRRRGRPAPPPAGQRAPRRGPPARGPGTARPAPGGWRQLSGPAKAGYIAMTLVSVIVVVASLGAYAVYAHLDGNIQTVKVAGLSHRSVYGAQNILVLGSQTRAGQGPGFGSSASLDTSNSDNLLLVHLDPAHTHAIVLSIPRDTMVYEPGCKARPAVGDGIWGPYQSAIIDGAMNIGGPSCAVRTVADLTGIALDHFVMFNFNSFRTMVDTIGGVEVCVPPGGYRDPYSRLDLSGGKHLLTYNEALAYVRTRHGVGSGSDAGGDLPRIQLQQAFISSVIQKVSTQGILSNSIQLFKIANTATEALTVDQGLSSVLKLVGLARSLVHLRPANVTLITMPTVPDPADPDRLLPEEPQDDVLFQMIRTGQLWRRHLPTLPPGQVQVHVLNGTGIAGLAGRTADRLRRLGFDVIGTGNTAPASTSTVSYSGTAQADSADTLMSALKGAPAAQNMLAGPAPQADAPGPVTLIIGAGFAGVNAPAAVTPGPGSSPAVSQGSPPASVETRNAAASICSGLPPANPDPGTPP